MFARLTTPPQCNADGTIRIQYAVWRNRADFSDMTKRGYRRRKGGVRVRDGNGRLIYCRAANTHKIQWQPTGSRIVELRQGDQVRWRLNDGSLFDPSTYPALSEQQLARINEIGFVRENFSRDIRAEARRLMEEWLNREQNRADRGKRDINGHKFMERFAGRTTLNLQVATSADDGTAFFASTFSATSGTSIIGYLNGGSDGFSRFVTSLDTGIQIDSALVQFNVASIAGTPTGRIKAENTTAPTAPTTYADYKGRTRTTAFTDLTTSVASGWATYEIDNVLQEVVNVGSVSALLITADGTNLIPAWWEFNTYDFNSSLSTKLDIDYTVPLTGPDNLIATQTDSDQVTLTWDDLASGETGYEIQRESPVGGGFSTIATIAAEAETYQDNGLAPGEYNYRVRAVGSGDPSDWSNTSSVVIVGGGLLLHTGLLTGGSRSRSGILTGGRR